MAAPRVLVTGCARSGTGYTAALLTRLGVDCGHERLYEPGRIQAAGKGRLDVAPGWPKAVAAESSWLAAPFLRSLHPGTLVLHQVRHPLEVMRSKLRTRFFETPTAYLDLAAAHLAQLQRGSSLERAARYWVGWNELVERAERWTSLRYRRHRLEDVNEAFLLELLAELGRETSPVDVARALSEVARDTNTRGDRAADARVRLEALPEDLLRDLDSMGQRYGYPRVHSPPSHPAALADLPLG